MEALDDLFPLCLLSDLLSVGLVSRCPPLPFPLNSFSELGDEVVGAPIDATELGVLGGEHVMTGDDSLRYGNASNRGEGVFDLLLDDCSVRKVSGE